MQSFIKTLAALTLLASCQQSSNLSKSPEWPDDIKPPTAEKIVKSFSEHGENRNDDYYWLNQREDEKVLNYLRAENAYADTMMASTKDLQSKLFAEMKGRIKEKDESVPYKKNGYWYVSRFDEGAQYPVYVRKKESLTAPDEVLIDQNIMAKGFPYFSVGNMAISDDNKIMAYTVDTVSRRLYGIRFKDLTTGTVYPETISNAEGRFITWAADNKTFFYVKKDVKTLLGYQVYRHLLGTDPSQDVLVYEEKDNTFSVQVKRSRSDKYIFIVSELNQVSTEYKYLDASNPTAAFKMFLPRERQVYEVDHAGDKFYIMTDKDAPNFRIMTTDENNTAFTNWKEMIPQRDNVLIADFTLFKDFVVLQEMKDALNQVRVIKPSSNQDYYISFDESVFTSRINYNPEYNSNTVRISYTSPTTPNSVIDVNMDTKAQEVKKVTEVIGYDKSKYQAERIWATSSDGVKIPVSLVYKKGMEKNSKNPLLLYGYGSYGYNSDPGFSSTVVSLLDRGFIYAIAHIRGGQEMGRQWYDNGKMGKKKNTFQDFIDCGEFLVKENYTSKEHLYANGGSAGGLLMGAVVNMRPDLFHGVIAEVPFVDVITTMSDESIPLTTQEYKEWGNPNVKEEYAYMKSYSPYDNVEKKEYPNMLVTTGLHDSQVQYFEPAKWVAKLREYKTGNNVLFFRTNMDAGHGGASGRFDYLKDEAVNMAFLLALEGITE
ncbi:MAG: S9 family peptidase [Flavitalea sp.]